MPILEVTQLRLKGCSADDPKLLDILSAVRDRLQTGSQFYTSIEEPTKLYIFGVWRDLKQHLDFLASPLRSEVLGPQEDMLDLEWTLHIEIEGRSALPLDAPFLVLEILRVKKDGVAALEPAVTRHVQQIQGSSAFKVLHGWRRDAAPASNEVVFISGSEDTRACVSFAAQQTLSDDAVAVNRGEDEMTIRGGYEEILLHHCRNLERNGV
jgi:hypothetical protein